MRELRDLESLIMNIEERIAKVLAEWPVMIEALKKIDTNLSRRPNTPPDHMTLDHAILINFGRKLAQEMNLELSHGVLGLEMFVEWCFDKMSPTYRIAKWYGMLEYMKSKYGKYTFPSRSNGDPREYQYYNMITLLRSTYRGKTKSIILDKSLLSLPYAKKWICVPNKKGGKNLSNTDWLNILQISYEKYGSHRKPSSRSKDPEERKLYRLILQFRKAYKNGSLKEPILKLPKAKEWITGTDPNTEYWQKMLEFINSKYGKLVEPNIRSKDKKERSFASKIANWRNALKHKSSNAPHPKLLKLPMAKEWLSQKQSKVDQIKQKWLDYLDYTRINYGEFQLPKVSSKDSRIKSFYSYIRNLRERLKDLSSIEQDEILSLPMAKEWLKPTDNYLKASDKWNEMLKFLRAKYGECQHPRSLANDPVEKNYYSFVYRLRKRIKEENLFPESLSNLPMAKEWLSK